MTAFTDHSIDLMEKLAQETENRINMNRRGYLLATRSNDVDNYLRELEAGYLSSENNAIRIHDRFSAGAYEAPVLEDGTLAPSGVDVIKDPELIRRTFPSYDHEIRTAIHIRRGGSISGQQMGQHMLELYKATGGLRVTGKVQSIDISHRFQARLTGLDAAIDAD